MSGVEDDTESSGVKEALKTVVPHKVAVNHTEDDETLVDVKVNNPLKRITELLEQIKKQKAFSFTLKGSLGIAGIALIVTTFGIFGGTKAFCSKGTQSQIGTLRELNVTVSPQRNYILERALIAWYALTGKDFERRDRQRVVLVKNDMSVMTVKERVEGLNLASVTTPVIVTGDIDSCAQEITIKDVNGVQAY